MMLYVKLQWVEHIEYIIVVRHSHLLVSFGSLITWVSCLDGDDGKGISVKIGLKKKKTQTHTWAEQSESERKSTLSKKKTH